MTEYEKKEKELWDAVYNAIPYNVEDIVLPDFIREEIANQIMPELSKLALFSTEVRSDNTQICYKTNEPCKYDCGGLCKDSY